MDEVTSRHREVPIVFRRDKPFAGERISYLPPAILGHHLPTDLQDGVLADQGSHAPDSLPEVGLQHGGCASEGLDIKGKLLTGNEAVGSDLDKGTEGLFAHGQIHSETHAMEARGRERGRKVSRLALTRWR